MIEIPVLETERLRLRAPSERDFEEEVEFYASERSRFVGGPMEREAVWRSLASILGHWQLRGYGFWAVEELATGNYCGRVGLWNPEGWPEPEVGWTLMKHAEGKGYGIETALKAREYAYRTLKWPTAISLIDPENKRSAALAERMGASPDYEYVHPQYGKMMVWRHPPPQEVT